VLIEFKAKDTVFYYKVNEQLRQGIEVLIENKTGQIQTGIVKITANGFEPVNTNLHDIAIDKGIYTVYAPVVFPNVGTEYTTYRGGKHHSVQAKIELTVGSSSLSKDIKIGRWRPWTVYVCQDTCADFTWRLNEEDTIKCSSNLTESHLQTVSDTKDMPFESQNRWNINQTMDVMWFIERKKEKMKELLKRVKDDHVSISPIFNACLTGIMSTEQAIRSLYYARQLERDYGVDYSVVEHIEVPTITWGMATLFSNAGLKYFVKGWLLWMVPFNLNRDDIPIFYWEGPDGSKILTASDKGASLRDAYCQGIFLSRTYEEAIEELHDWWIPHFEDHAEYPYDAFILLGSHGDLAKESEQQIPNLVSNIIKYNSEPW